MVAPSAAPIITNHQYAATTQPAPVHRILSKSGRRVSTTFGIKVNDAQACPVG